ncbi:hypothetical protein SKAU_G00028950 [Synaphobranchus kaupii]|uniref:Uncharacterized protein n=1 Tax=Synaphobranchus kaupii TaxID=118154 RepID=A0A9Q1GDW4_SYNKA|nr:hypothetical protein SKAU_G00028950 [Synaphobranchus kaupii]
MAQAGGLAALSLPSLYMFSLLQLGFHQPTKWHKDISDVTVYIFAAVIPEKTWSSDRRQHYKSFLSLKTPLLLGERDHTVETVGKRESDQRGLLIVLLKGITIYAQEVIESFRRKVESRTAVG